MGERFPLDFARAWGEPVCTAAIRAVAEDFQVVEELAERPTGNGEHLFLRVRKRGQNTEWVARALAQALQVRARDVSYAGLKDRHAVTTQWFSGWLPGRADPPLSRIAVPGVEILEARRHRSKLRRGALAGNRFELLLRGLPEDAHVREALVRRLARIAKDGVPNYFGEQRFGLGGANLAGAELLLVEGGEVRDRHLRGIYLSAARAYLFNLIVSARVAEGSWRSLATQGQGTAPLFGSGTRLDELERSVLRPWRRWCDGLERLQLRPEGRRLCMPVAELEWEFPLPGCVRLRFLLGKGCYATALLRELIWVEGAEEL